MTGAYMPNPKSRGVRSQFEDNLMDQSEIEGVSAIK